ncbi:MAG: hypothetical protein ABIA78_00600 [archaeon]
MVGLYELHLDFNPKEASRGMLKIYKNFFKKYSPTVFEKTPEFLMYVQIPNEEGVLSVRHDLECLNITFFQEIE